MKEENLNIQIEQSIMFNMKGQFISKYARNTLIKPAYGYEQSLFFKKDEGQLLDLYLKNFQVSVKDPNWNLSIMGFFNEYAQSSIKYRYLEEIVSPQTIKLPAPKKIKIKLTDALAMRQSSRTFDPNYQMTLSDLATLLNLAFQHQKNGHRPYASGGGLYPIYLYLYIDDVKDLPAGFYKYQPFHKSLQPIKQEKIIIDKVAYLEKFNLEGIKVILFYVYNSYINRFKYGDQSLIFSALEAGMMIQNIDLLATGLGLGVCNLGGYESKYILEKLYLSQYFSTAVLNVTVIGGYKYDQ